MRLLILLLLFSGRSFSQDPEPDTLLPYARKIVDTLSSPSMHGRGYYKNGDKIAASYIGTEFSKMRINWKYQDQIQNIVSFPKKITCSVGNKVLHCGSDFIADAGSRSVKGTLQLVRIDSSIVGSMTASKNFLSMDYEGKALLVDHESIKNKESKGRLLSLVRIAKASLLVFIDSKLTHTIASELEPIAAIHIRAGSFPEDAKTITVNIRSKVLNNYSIRSVIATVEGRIKDSFLVFSAHYDHLGRMGPDVLFPGANDNASGIAMLLSLAKHFSNPAHQPKYSMLFIAFGGEEAGLVGSHYYVNHPTVPLRAIKFVVNMDILGTGDEGITVVNATQHEPEFKKLVKLNAQKSYLKEVKSRGKAANSDHYWFSEKGVPAFFIYTLGGIKAYHDIYDRKETLPLTEFHDLFYLLLDFTEHFEH